MGDHWGGHALHKT